MIDQICNSIKNKKILILGFGREGKSTYQFIRKYLPDKEVGIYDKNPILDTLTNVVLHCGDTFEEILSEYDMVIKSPGIVLQTTDTDILKKCTSQTDLFLDYYRTQTIGITGTKGKSTTTSLLYHILHTAGKDALLVGNIGIPVFDALENIHEKTIVVFELSSHQLEYVTHSPHIGVLLNIFEEHLDHYGTFEKYKTAKENIYRFQQKGDVLLYNQEFFNLPNNFAADTVTITNSSDMADTITITNNSEKADTVTIANYSELADAVIKANHIFYQGNVFDIEEDKIQLKGIHNLYNIGAAYVLAKTCGITDSQFREGIHTFKPLPHRLEYVGEVDSIKFYNDSISTICETTIQGVNSLTDVDTVILGGMDRGISYEPLADFLLESEIRNIILMPDTGYRIQKLLESSDKKNNNHNIVSVANVQEAVAAAKKVTMRHKTCLFSPAAASYGFFKNFEERGEVFKKYVLG